MMVAPISSLVPILKFFGAARTSDRSRHGGIGLRELRICVDDACERMHKCKPRLQRPRMEPPLSPKEMMRGTCAARVCPDSIDGQH